MSTIKVVWYDDNETRTISLSFDYKDIDDVKDLFDMLSYAASTASLDWRIIGEED